MKNRFDYTRAPRALFFVLCVSLCLLTLYFAASRRSILGYDGEAYILTAEQGMENPLHYLTAGGRRPPFYPIVLMLSFLLCGKTLLALHVFPLLFMLASPLLFYLLVRRISGSRWWALFGAAAFLFFPGGRTWMCQPLTEPTAIFLVLFSLLLLECITPKKKYLLLPLIVTLLALFTLKFELASASLVFTACGIYRCVDKQRLNRKRTLLMAGAAVICVILLFLALQFMAESGALPKRMSWQWRMLDANFGKSMDQIYKNEDFGSLLLKDLKSFFRHPVSFLVFIALGVLSSLRLKRGDLPWYLLFPVILYFTIFFSGFGKSMMRLISPSIPVFALFVVLGIMYLFQRVRDLTKPPIQTVLLPASVILVCLMMVSGYCQADQQWRHESAFKRDVAPLWLLWTRNVDIPHYRARKALTKQGRVFNDELHSYINGFFRTPHHLEKWRNRCDGLPIGFVGGKQNWRAFAHSILKDGQPADPADLSFPGAQKDGREVEIVFQFDFKRPIHTLHYLDRHHAPGQGDGIVFHISPDGQNWQRIYEVSHEGGVVTWGAHFRKGFSGRSDVFLKYRFKAASSGVKSPREQGPRLTAACLAADFSPCRPLFGEDWPVDAYESD